MTQENPSDHVRPELLDPLLDWLRIPSVSTGKGDPEALQAAAEWARDRVREAGGTCDVVPTDWNPIVLGRFEANRADAPTVMIYGHYDVQGPEPIDEWTAPPFEPTIRDGRIYARGASDDKGNLWPLLFTACEMAKAGELPVNVRVLVEGEEERGSEGFLSWLAADKEPADACIVYDSGSLGSRPTITIGARGVIAGYVRVQTATTDLHSGIYGGTVPNALHELQRVLAAVLPLADGRLREELRAGVIEVPDVEQEMWTRFPPGDKAIAAVGGRPLHDTSGDRYYELTGFEPSLDVNEIKAGDPRTVIPARANAYISMRLGPGQRSRDMIGMLERLMREAAHPEVEVSFKWQGGVDAASFDPEDPVILAGRRAYKKAFGVEATLWRLGGTLPLLDVLVKRGIPTILTGFAGAGDRIHAPDESYELASLEKGATAARALFEELSELR